MESQEQTESFPNDEIDLSDLLIPDDEIDSSDLWDSDYADLSPAESKSLGVLPKTLLVLAIILSSILLTIPWIFDMPIISVVALALFRNLELWFRNRKYDTNKEAGY